jgi:hypothetical protein
MDLMLGNNKKPDGYMGERYLILKNYFIRTAV